MITSNFEPRVLIYFCNHCCGSDANGDHLSLDHLACTIISMHFQCAREVTPAQIREGFADGADGVLICGCLVRGCENSPDNRSVLSSLYRNLVTVKQTGLAADRLREEWVVHGTTDSLESILSDFSEKLRELGPIKNIERVAVAES